MGLPESCLVIIMCAIICAWNLNAWAFGKIFAFFWVFYRNFPVIFPTIDRFGGGKGKFSIYTTLFAKTYDIFWKGNSQNRDFFPKYFVLQPELWRVATQPEFA